ncbi:MAG: DUF1816 domain-containing protein [Synechococcaceae cyanobacterium SM2_3_60]|nr:DUF1816 domain-containing protein [Synechococcaceae cyanobacterium SM2_3_60]
MTGQAMVFKQMLTGVSELLGMAHWMAITTQDPEYIYYFGPFLTEAEADSYRQGYVSDLEAEGAKVIDVKIQQRRKPDVLTQDLATLTPKS